MPSSSTTSLTVCSPVSAWVTGFISFLRTWYLSSCVARVFRRNVEVLGVDVAGVVFNRCLPPQSSWAACLAGCSGVIGRAPLFAKLSCHFHTIFFLDSGSLAGGGAVSNTHFHVVSPRAFVLGGVLSVRTSGAVLFTHCVGYGGLLLNWARR